MTMSVKQGDVQSCCLCQESWEHKGYAVRCSLHRLGRSRLLDTADAEACCFSQVSYGMKLQQTVIQPRFAETVPTLARPTAESMYARDCMTPSKNMFTTSSSFPSWECQSRSSCCSSHKPTCSPQKIRHGDAL